MRRLELAKRVISAAAVLEALAADLPGPNRTLLEDARTLRSLDLRIRLVGVRNPEVRSALLRSGLSGSTPIEIDLLSIRVGADRKNPRLLTDLAIATVSELINRWVNVTPAAVDIQISGEN